MGAQEWGVVLAVAPTALALIGAVAALVLDAAGRRTAGVAVVAAVSFAAAGVGLYAGFTIEPERVFSAFAGGSAFSGVTGLVHALAALAILGGYRRLTASANGAQLAALVAFSAAAAGVLLASLDMLALVVALEAVALTGYALVSGARSGASDEAAMKYFIQGAVATGLLVYALAVLFGLFGGELFMPDLARALEAGSGRAALTALALLLAAFSFKLGAFPFHSWAPDAYQTAPPSMAAFLATGPKLAALVAVFVVFPAVVFRSDAFGTAAGVMFAALAIASMVFGNLGGLKQVSYTRMLAYSGIAQVGYALVGFAAVYSVSPLQPRQSFPVLMFGAVYSFAALGAFLGAEAIRSARPDWDGTVAGLAGLGRQRPLLSVALAACLLSLTGIPLTAGFWGKFLVFGYAVGTGRAWLAILGVLASVVSFGYYGGVIKAIYLDEPAEDEALPVLTGYDAGGSQPARADVLAEGSVLFAAVAVVAIGVVPLFIGLDFLAAILSLPL